MSEAREKNQGEMFGSRPGEGQAQKADKGQGRRPCKTLFITGTGTDVGKTYVTGLILRKLHQEGSFRCLLQGSHERKRPGGGGKPDSRGCPYREGGIGNLPAFWKKCAPTYMRMRFPLIWLPGWRGIRLCWSRCRKALRLCVGSTNM